MTNDRKARAARAEQMRKERQKADRRQRNLITVAIVAIVILLIAVAGWGIKSIADANQDETKVIEPRNLVEGGVEFPANAGVDNSKAPLVQTFEDFQCPVCQQFEQLSGSFLQDQAASGQIRLVFMPHSFLDDQGGSSNEYSRRSTNLAMCVTDESGAEDFWKIHSALYLNQPDEGTAGPSDTELIATAKTAGVTVDETCVKSHRFVPWIDKAKDDQQTNDDVTGTPTIWVNGKVTEARTPDELQKAIDAASKS